jgi:dynein heavy chain
MQQATDLIGGLAGERKRWTEDSAKFDATKTALVGDVAVGAISASHVGAFTRCDSCPSHFHESGFFVEFE